MELRDRMLALLEDKLPSEFTVSTGGFSFDVSLDLDDGSDPRWAPKFVTGLVSYGEMPGEVDGVLDANDDSVGADVLRLIGKKIGATAHWTEGAWVPNRVSSSVYSAFGKTMTRHFATNKRQPK